jgi:hypothetical protein
MLSAPLRLHADGRNRQSSFFKVNNGASLNHFSRYIGKGFFSKTLVTVTGDLFTLATKGNRTQIGLIGSIVALQKAAKTSKASVNVTNVFAIVLCQCKTT